MSRASAGHQHLGLRYRVRRHRARPCRRRPVSLDSNLRLRCGRWTAPAPSCARRYAADLFLPSMDDMQHLTGNDDPERTLDWIRDAGATGVVVLKLGKDGSIIDDGHGRKPVAALRWRRSTPPARATASPAACWPAAARAIPGRTRCAMPMWRRPCPRWVWRGRAPAQRGAGPGETVGSALDLGSLGPVGVFFGFQAKMPSYPNFPPACR